MQKREIETGDLMKWFALLDSALTDAVSICGLFSERIQNIPLWHKIFEQEAFEFLKSLFHLKA